jgi:hypothetical protein
MKPDAILFITAFVLAAGFGVAQSRGGGQTPLPPRTTPLGTQRPKPAGQNDKKNETVRNERPADTVERALNAHGGRQAWNSVRDSISEGKLTFFTGKTSKNTVAVTVIRKGDSHVQRILKDGDGELVQGADGTSTWESFNGMTALAPAGLAGSYLESQTVRSVGNLFDAQARGRPVREAGTKDNERVLELEAPLDGQAPRKTRYFVDEATSRVTRIEFVTGEARDLLGKTVPATESYVFSDYRLVQGIASPFRIERYVNGLKIEETQFTTVRYNTSVKAEAFKP